MWCGKAHQEGCTSGCCDFGRAVSEDAGMARQETERWGSWLVWQLIRVSMQARTGVKQAVER